MRITYLHYLYGEDTALHHARQFVEAVRSLGHEISVHAMNLAPTGNGGGVRAGTRQWLKSRLSRYLHEPKELLWNAPYTMRELAVVRAERPDVLLVREHYLTTAELAVRAITGVPLVLEINSPANESARYFDEYSHLPWMGMITERLKLRHADTVTAVSGALKDYFVTAHGVPPEKILVNVNGADCERFDPGLDGSPIRRAHGLGDHPVVGFVGSLHPWHGPELLKGLIGSLYESGVRFLLVGDGPGWRELRRWIEERGYHERIAIPGSVPHAKIPAYVAAMDVSIIPDSNFYGSSLKTLEYMAAGKAIVAPAYEPFLEVIEHGRHGMLFPPGDLDALIWSVEILLANGELRRQLGFAARERVVNHFTWRHNAQRVVDACRAACAARVRLPADRPSAVH